MESKFSVTICNDKYPYEYCSTGIGLETVRHLARAGAKVYLAARNESRAAGALEQLEHDGLNGEVIWLKLDLSDPRDAKKAADDFLRKERRLDILGEFFRVIYSCSVLIVFNSE